MAETKSSEKPVKYFDDQFDDEEMLFIFRKHPIVMRRGLIFGLGAWLIGPIYMLILTYTNPNNPPSLGEFGLSLLISVVVGLIIFTPWYISWHFSVFIVTDQRLIQITQKGLFHRSVVDMGLNQVQMVNYQIAGLQETLLGFGTIVMQTFVGDLVIHEVHHPDRIQKKLLGVLRNHTAIAPPYMPAQNSVTDEDEETEVS